LITNADPHSIGTVGVIGSGGATSTVAVLADELEKGDHGEYDFTDGDDEFFGTTTVYGAGLHQFSLHVTKNI
jgi:hypothetical protein